MLATRDSFGTQLAISGGKDSNIVVLSADLSKATKTSEFAKLYPDRFFELGIAECNMIGIASGMSNYKYKVVISSFATFLTGKYDPIRVSIAYSNAPVILVGTHAGLAIGKDGVTQMGLEDLSLMRSLPNMQVFQPSTAIETREVVKYLLETAELTPTYLRLGRQPIPEMFQEDYVFTPHKGVVLKDGTDIAIFSTGCLLHETLSVAQSLESKFNISCAVINIHTIKPLDNELVIHYANKCRALISVEDHSIIGGLGTAISEVTSEYAPVKLKRIGVSDCFPESGSPKDLWDKYGLSANKIEQSILDFIK